MSQNVLGVVQEDEFMHKKTIKEKADAEAYSYTPQENMTGK
jgi:hypothetical protein